MHCIRQLPKGRAADWQTTSGSSDPAIWVLSFPSRPPTRALGRVRAICAALIERGLLDAFMDRLGRRLELTRQFVDPTPRVRQLDKPAPIFHRIWCVRSWHWGPPSYFLPNTVYENGKNSTLCIWILGLIGCIIRPSLDAEFIPPLVSEQHEPTTGSGGDAGVARTRR
jgi:hypothetical protein